MKRPPSHLVGLARARLWLASLGLLLLFAALRWNSYDAPLTRDEGEYAYSAQVLRHGLTPYEHSFLQKPPMVVYSYAVADFVAPHVFWFPRVLAYAFAALATVLLGYIARREFGPGVALPAMWMMTPMILLAGLEQFTANTEMFMLLPMVATVAIYVYSRHRGGGPAVWVAGGLLGAVTICYKYTAFPVLALVFAAWSFDEWRQGKSARRLCLHWLLALFGMGAASAIVLGLFLGRDGGKHLWDCTVLFNRFYAAETFAPSSLWSRMHELWDSWWILFLVPLLLVFRREARVLFWLGMFFAAWVTTAASQYGHYYITVMPFWALLMAVAIRSFVTWLHGRPPKPQNWSGPILTALVVLVLCWADVPWIMRTKERFATDKMKGWSAFLESRQIAQRIGELTTPQDFVYVAGSEPQILYYARRFSPTRFIIAYPLMIPTPLAKGYQEEAIQDLEKRPPAVIALVRSNTSWLRQNDSPPDLLSYLTALLKEHYDALGGYVVSGEGGYWQEPLVEEDLEKMSVLLFKRKP
jgi:hypothetical protein